MSDGETVPGWEVDEPPRMWWKPEDDRGPACLSIEVIGGQKRYRRLWAPGDPNESLEWGWVLAETAIPLRGAVTDDDER